jgi:hypothetical protein
MIISFISALKRSSFLVRLVRYFRRQFIAFLFFISPVILAKYRFYKVTGGRLNLKHPTDFDEKLFWQMLYWKDPLKTYCADKYSMRTYVQEHGLGCMLPELLGVYTKAEEINFKLLPSHFVLKCTHGCGFNIFCKEKSQLDTKNTIRQLKTWMKTDFSKVFGEIHYGQIKPQIICEEYLGDSDGNLPVDYKVYCFSGRAFCTNVCLGRSEDGHNAEYFIYDLAWENKLPFEASSLKSKKTIAKPQGYEEMIKAAEILSKPFPFVRVDFYSYNERILVGEMTFTPSGCIDFGLTNIGQRALGELFVLPQEKIK